MSEIFGEILSSVGEKISEKVKTSLDFSSFLQKQLSELEAKYEQDLIPDDLYEETKANILGFFQEFGEDFEALKQKISQEKQEIMQQIGSELSQEKRTLQAQMSIYELADINRFTYQNGAIKQLAKGLIDELVIGNAELVEMVVTQGPGIFWDGIKNMLTWEGLKEMFSSLGMSISDLFSGDAYKTGISIAAFAGGLLKVGSGALKKSLKKGVKKELDLDVTYFSKNVDYSVEGKTLKIDTMDVNLLTPEHMKTFLYDLLEDAKRAGKEITEIDFGSNLKSEIKALLHHTLARNFPVLNIARLAPGDSVVNFTYAGVKKLNDISYEFADAIVGIVQSKIAYELAKFSNTRDVRQTYKHHTFSLENADSVTQLLQETFGSSQQMVKEIFDSLGDSDILATLKNTKNSDLDALIKAGDMTAVRDFLSQQLDEHFLIQMGVAKIPEAGTILEKSMSLYQAESSARNANNGFFKAQEFSFDTFVETTKEMIALQKEIVSKYKNTIVLVDDLPYKVIQNGELNLTLLGKIRKGENIGNPEIQKMMTQYAQSLNKNFDFIAPFQRGDDLVDQVAKLNTSIQTGKIPVKYLTTNYKGQFTPEALNFITKDMPGTRVSADVKGMYLLNLKGHEELARQVASGKITASNATELLYAGEGVTTNFLQAADSIKRNFPGAITSVGGDELSVFIPKVGGKFDVQVGEMLGRYSLESRVLMSIKKGKGIFRALDERGQVLKWWETKLEELEAKLGHKLHNNFTTFDGFDAVTDFTDIQKAIGNISLEDLGNFIQSNQSKMTIGQTDNLRIIIKKLPNNNFTLSLEP